MTVYGYARVSTADQSLAGQAAELAAAGCAKVFREKASGAKTDRAELAKVIRVLDEGDVLLITRLAVPQTLSSPGRTLTVASTATLLLHSRNKVDTVGGENVGTGVILQNERNGGRFHA